MPSNRRNSAVACNNGVPANRLESWRRSFRQQKRTSMLDMNTLHRQPTPNQAEIELMAQQKFLFPFADPGCSFEYSNQVVHIGHSYEFVDSEESNIGHGAYGDVFSGKSYDFDRQHYRAVAIKRISEINVKSNELEAMKRVQNPFLVALIDICHDENHLNTYIVMELCDLDLDKYLKLNTHDGSLTRSEYNLVMTNLVFGYYALYKENIIHRDIKAQNVLLVLSPNGNGIQIAKLTDFGVCRVLEDADGTLSNIAGSLYYLAPEVGANILKTSEYNNKVDMWSIGCLLVQCLTGQLPFEEQELCKLFLHCACGNFYDAAPDLSTDIPQSDVNLIKGLLEIDPSKRCTPEKLYEFALKRMQNKD